MIQLTRELLQMTSDYLTDPSDYFRLRSCCRRIRNSLPDKFGTTLDVCLRGWNACWGRVFHYRASNRLYWDLSKEMTFPHDHFKKGKSGKDLQFNVWAVESIARGCCPSRVDEHDLYFLLDWALEYVHGSALEGLVKLCRDSEVIKSHRMEVLQKALSGHPNVDAGLIAETFCDPEVDFPVSDSWSVQAITRSDNVVLKLISLGALSVNARDPTGRSLLICSASRSGDVAISLIVHGARVDVVDNRGMNALDYLILAGDIPRSVQLAKLLLEKGLKMTVSRDAFYQWEGTPLIRYLKLVL